MAPDRVRRIGVSGIGSIGARHARILGSMSGVATVLYDALTEHDELVGRFAGAEVVSSFEELLDARLDGLVVATPDQVHPSHAAAACARRLPVLLEKPVAVSRAAADPIVRASKENGTPVLVGYVLRYVRCLARVRALLLRGAIGTPVSFHATLGAYETLVLARNRFTTATQDALFIDYSHEWDYLRWLLGPIDGGFAVAHQAGDLPLLQDPNVVDAVLRMQSGATGTAHLDYVQQDGSRTCRIIGDRGTLEVDVRQGRLTMNCVGRTPVIQDLAEPRDRAFRAQAEHFLDVIAGRAVPRVTLDDGLAALDVAEALIESVARGRWQLV
jgi:predicted dehydrogenase